MTVCGTYTISTVNYGTDACKGEAKGGLQPDFWKCFQELDTAAHDAGVNLALTAADANKFMTLKEMENAEKKGNAWWKKSSASKRIKQFIGSGLLIHPTLKMADTGSTTLAAGKLDTVKKLANEHGLQLVQDSSTHVRYITPAHYKFSNDKSSYVEYSSDYVAIEGVDNASSSEDSGGQASIGSIAYFFSNQFASFVDAGTANALTGNRALANDVKLSDAVFTACKSSLREYCSAPNGAFVAWYPDYWGVAGNDIFYDIEDIELKDLKITQSDNTFYSHVYCPVVNYDGSSIDYRLTQAVVSIESDVVQKMEQAASTDQNLKNEDNERLIPEASDKVSAILKRLINIPEDEEWKYTPKELYRRYGARPCKTASIGGEAKLIEVPGEGKDGTAPSHIMPYLYALYTFMNNWAEQNHVDITITFNPEIFPGARIRVKSFGISCYVQNVTHTMSYTNGFTTTLSCIAPAGTLVSGMIDIKDGTDELTEPEPPIKDSVDTVLKGTADTLFKRVGKGKK